MDTTHSRSEAQLIEERLAFARNTNNDETLERTLQQRDTLDLQPRGWLAHEPHSAHFRNSPKQENNKVIRFRKLKPLGRGNQGQVYEVVDMDTNTHYACKIVDVGKVAAEWKNHAGKDYRTRLKWEVEMVRNNLTHVSSLPRYSKSPCLPHANQVSLVSCHTRTSRIRNSAPISKYSCRSIRVTSTIYCEISEDGG